MKLLINGSAVMHSSIGVRRYYETVTRHLNWGERQTTTHVFTSRRLDRFIELLRRGASDTIFWSPAQRGSLRAINHVVTVHDCINVEHVYVGDWRLPALRRATQRLLSNAQKVVAISEATKAAILRNYHLNPEDIVVIPSSCRIELGKSSCLVADTRPYVLLVSNALPHKNTLITCQAFARSLAAREGGALRVVGAIDAAALEFCRSAGVDLQLNSNINDNELRRLYEGARFLISPSLAEGHNLPVAEALSTGTEVLCSDIPAHREFYSGLVEFFDPSRLDAIVEAIDRAWCRPTPWFPGAALPARSFADVAQDYRTLFDEIVAANRAHGARIST